jgi:hypothetical protein
MFVKPARSAVERNMTVYQHGSDIMFVTTKDVQPDTELLFWFAADYAKIVCELFLLILFCTINPVIAILTEKP